MNDTNKKTSETTSSERPSSVQKGGAKLPDYAYPYHPAREQRGDQFASFYEDLGGGTITVGVLIGEGGTLYLEVDRGGMTEAQFTPRELGRVLEVAHFLYSNAVV